jgi:hypothetical protein
MLDSIEPEADEWVMLVGDCGVMARFSAVTSGAAQAAKRMHALRNAVILIMPPQEVVGSGSLLMIHRKKGRGSDYFAKNGEGRRTR